MSISRERLVSLFKWHRRVFALAMVALLAVNIYAGGGWWTFWPMLGWSFAFGLHFCVHTAVTVDEDWVNAREDDLRMRSYDLGHIQDIEGRLREKDNSIRPMVYLEYAARRRKDAESKVAERAGDDE